MLVALLSAMLLRPGRESACAIHGLGAASAPQVAMAGMSHASPDVPAAAQDAGGDSHGIPDGACDCSCIGDCTMVAPLATTPAVVTLRIALIDPEPRRPLDSEPAPPSAVEPDRLLPFANGPPAVAV